MSRRDAIVVGGGPAGLATALALRGRGASPLVLDRRTPPLDKACGEGLMPDGLAVLRRLGVTAAGMPFRGIRYCDEESVADAPFPGGAGLGIRRTTLHAALAAAAAAAGIEVRWGTRVESVSAGGEVRLAGGAPLAADWVVAADGLLSPLRAALGLAGPPAHHRRFGVRRHYRLAPWNDRVEVHWRPGVEAYVTPVAADEVGVAMLWTPAEEGSGGQHAVAAAGAADGDGDAVASGSGQGSPAPAGAGGSRTFDALLARFPELAERLAAAEQTSRDRGAGPFRQRVRGVLRGRVALVGDAAGYLDAITGEGLGLAFQQAEALATALAAGQPAAYAAACRRLRRVPDAFTHLLLFCERRPWLRRRILRELARRPDLFGRLLGVHTRQLPARRVGARAVAGLLLGVLRGS